MNKKNNLRCVDYILCSNWLAKLETLEIKCDRVTNNVAEVKNMIASLLSVVETLIGFCDFYKYSYATLIHNSHKRLRDKNI